MAKSETPWLRRNRASEPWNWPTKSHWKHREFPRPRPQNSSCSALTPQTYNSPIFSTLFGGSISGLGRSISPQPRHFRLCHLGFPHNFSRQIFWYQNEKIPWSLHTAYWRKNEAFIFDLFPWLYSIPRKCLNIRNKLGIYLKHWAKNVNKNIDVQKATVRISTVCFPKYGNSNPSWIVESAGGNFIASIPKRRWSNCIRPKKSYSSNKGKQISVHFYTGLGEFGTGISVQSLWVQQVWYQYFRYVP